jgi:transposase
LSAERLSMRKLREVLRLSLALKLGPRAIERSCKISSSTVSGYVGRAKVARLVWPLPPELDDDAALERLLFPDEGRPKARRPEPDWARIHLELRKKHVTKALLWEEHKSEQPDGLQYSQFCEHYNRWAQRLTVTMRQTHRAGEKMFVDFSGDGIDIVNPDTGECVVAKLFVAVLGASNLTYVEPVLSEDLPTWTGCHVRALEFFGGVAEIWVPDNLKSGVKSPDLYEPELNQTYAELARHYEAAVIPARVRKPRDKAKVEQGVLLAERWILAVLRNRTFFSLAELREAVKPLLEKLNNRPMQKLKKSRRQLFEELERPALRALPTRPYEFAHWARPRLHIDYHVEFAGYFYSAPYQLVGQRIDLRATESTVELFFKGRRVTSHVRRHTEKDKYATQDEHMPKAHQAQAEWTPVRLVSWAKKTGPATAKLVEELMGRRVHPQQAFKACLGILHLNRHYDDSRIEAACARALRMRACSWKSVKAILKNNLDRQPAETEPKQAALPLHGNVRGPTYYH